MTIPIYAPARDLFIPKEVGGSKMADDDQMERSSDRDRTSLGGVDCDEPENPVWWVEAFEKCVKNTPRGQMLDEEDEEDSRHHLALDSVDVDARALPTPQCNAGSAPQLTTKVLGTPADFYSDSYGVVESDSWSPHSSTINSSNAQLKRAPASSSPQTPASMSPALPSLMPSPRLVSLVRDWQQETAIPTAPDDIQHPF